MVAHCLMGQRESRRAICIALNWLGPIEPHHEAVRAQDKCSHHGWEASKCAEPVRLWQTLATALMGATEASCTAGRRGDVVTARGLLRV